MLTASARAQGSVEGVDGRGQVEADSSPGPTRPNRCGPDIGG